MCNCYLLSLTLWFNLPMLLFCADWWGGLWFWSLNSRHSHTNDAAFTADFPHCWVKSFHTSSIIPEADNYERLLWSNLSLDSVLLEIRRAKRRRGSQSRPSWLWKHGIWSTGQTRSLGLLQRITQKHGDLDSTLSQYRLYFIKWENIWIHLIGWVNYAFYVTGEQILYIKSHI